MVTSPYHKHLHPHLQSNIPAQSCRPRSQVSCTYSQPLCLKLSQIGPQKSISSWKAKWIRRVILLNLLSHALLSHNVKKLISKSAHSHLVISNLIKLTWRSSPVDKNINGFKLWNTCTSMIVYNDVESFR